MQGQNMKNLSFRNLCCPQESAAPDHGGRHDDTQLTEYEPSSQTIVSLKIMRFIEEYDLGYHAGGNILQSLHFLVALSGVIYVCVTSMYVYL